MISTKFYKILTTLSKEEFIQFEFFMKYIVKARPKCLSLYAIIKKAYIKSKYNWSDIKLEQAKINFELYQKKVKDTASLRELSSEFYKHLKRYCAYLQFVEDEDLYFLKYLNYNEVNDLFEKEFERIRKANDKIYGIDPLKRNIELTEFYETYKVKKGIQQTTDLNPLIKAFTNYSNLKHLQLYNAALQNSLARNITIDETLETYLTEILNHKKNILNKDLAFVFNIYVDSINMLKMQDEQKYDLLKKRVYQSFGIISDYDLYSLMNSLISFCNLQTQKKSPEQSHYYREELQLHYFYMYENGLLHEGTYVPAQHIKNICILAVYRIDNSGRLHLSAEDVKSLIENAKEKTAPRFRESTYHFNLGIFNLFQGFYDKAIKAFETKKPYANQYFKYDTKLNLLRCYYLTENDEKYNKMIIAFRTSLARDKILSEKEKTSYKNSIKAFVQLKKIKEDISFTYKYESASEIKKLKQFLSENTARGGAWFFEEIKKIGN